MLVSNFAMSFDGLSGVGIAGSVWGMVSEVVMLVSNVGMSVGGSVAVGIVGGV